MQRRMLLRALTAPALIGLARCAPTGVEALQSVAPSGPAAWNALPQDVRTTLSSNSFLNSMPPIGMQVLSVRQGSKGDILSDNVFQQLGPVFYHLSGLRAKTYTSANQDGQIQHVCGLNISNYATNWDKNDHPQGYEARSYSCQSLKIDSSARWKQGAEMRVEMVRVGVSPNGAPNGQTTLMERYLRLDKSYAAPAIWRGLVLGTVSITSPAWIVQEEFFLMGTHHRLHSSTDDGKVITTLMPEILGLELANAKGDSRLGDNDPAHYVTRGLFGVREEGVANHMRGDRFQLNADGQRRLKEAKIAVEAELYRNIATAAFVSADRKQAARPILARGRELWAQKQWMDAVRTLDEGLTLNPGDPASLVLYADALQHAFPRPSAQSVAADRLATLKRRMALALDPEGKAGAAARRALGVTA